MLGQTKVCEACLAASCSCAPLPLAWPGPLLPDARGRGWGGEQGGGPDRSLLAALK
jgi:hypothetical protein